MEWLANLPLVAQVIMYVVAFNVALGGVKGALDLIKDKTVSQTDNKAAEFLGKISGFLGKLLDILGYNKAH